MSETDDEFLDGAEYAYGHHMVPHHRARLFALARRGAAAETHGQVEKLSEELERTKREAERAQDAHGVRFLNYLEETARLTDEIERLRAALLPLVAECIEHCGDNCECYYKTPESCPTWQARAALAAPSGETND